MACRDVADLVAEYSRQLCLAVCICQNPTGEVNVASKERKSIDGGDANHSEVPVKFQTVRHTAQASSHLVQIILNISFLHHAVLRQYLRMGLSPVANFLFFRNKFDLAIVCDRVACTIVQWEGSESAQETGEDAPFR